jgi:hypothetical protein
MSATAQQAERGSEPEVLAKSLTAHTETPMTAVDQHFKTLSSKLCIIVRPCLSNVQAKQKPCQARW